jgi:hypothetical protein
MVNPQSGTTVESRGVTDETRPTTLQACPACGHVPTETVYEGREHDLVDCPQCDPYRIRWHDPAGPAQGGDDGRTR